jgi:DNA-binding IclR family transcriptional regulator
VLDALGAAPGSGPAAIAKASGVSTGVAAATLSRLVKQGHVRRLEPGRYAVIESATAAGLAEQGGDAEAAASKAG